MGKRVPVFCTNRLRSHPLSPRLALAELNLALSAFQHTFAELRLLERHAFTKSPKALAFEKVGAAGGAAAAPEEWQAWSACAAEGAGRLSGCPSASCFACCLLVSATASLPGSPAPAARVCSRRDHRGGAGAAAPPAGRACRAGRRAEQLLGSCHQPGHPALPALPGCLGRSGGCPRPTGAAPPRLSLTIVQGYRQHPGVLRAATVYNLGLPTITSTPAAATIYVPSASDARTRAGGAPSCPQACAPAAQPARYLDAPPHPPYISFLP